MDGWLTRRFEESLSSPDLGDVQLRGIEQPVRLYRLA
jgi:class 3 adenylate cyclase